MSMPSCIECLAPSDSACKTRPMDSLAHNYICSSRNFMQCGVFTLAYYYYYVVIWKTAYLSVGESVAECSSVVSCVGLSLGQSGVVRGLTLTLTTPFHFGLTIIIPAKAVTWALNSTIYWHSCIWEIYVYWECFNIKRVLSRMQGFMPRSSQCWLCWMLYAERQVTLIVVRISKTFNVYSKESQASCYLWV